MVTAVPTRYNVPHGATCYGGKNGPPSWIPPVGYFADVPMKNSADTLTPSIYAGNSVAMNDSFILWGGSAILNDYSPLGAQVYYTGGHESSPGQVHVQMSVLCDFSTLTWKVCNVPVAANHVGQEDGTGKFPDGTYYVPHTYLGVQERPAVWGGGPKGSLISINWAGSPYKPGIVSVDVSQQNNGWSMFVNDTVMPNIGTSYMASVMDVKRQGWWVSGESGSVNNLLFVSKTGTVTSYPALTGYASDDSLVICDSLDLLIQVGGGYDAGYLASNNYRTLNIRNLATGAVTSSLTLGTVPQVGNGYYTHGTGDNNPYNCYHAPGMMGLQWVDELGYIVGLDTTTTTPTLMKLAPPASNPATGQWTWSAVSVQHWSGGDPNGAATLLAGQNGVWNKLRWVPSLHAFVYCTSSTSKPQVIKL